VKKKLLSLAALAAVAASNVALATAPAQPIVTDVTDYLTAGLVTVGTVAAAALLLTAVPKLFRRIRGAM
jgi:hypothetical protein